MSTTSYISTIGPAPFLPPRKQQYHTSSPTCTGKAGGTLLLSVKHQSIIDSAAALALIVYPPLVLRISIAKRYICCFFFLLSHRPEPKLLGQTFANLLFITNHNMGACAHKIF